MTRICWSLVFVIAACSPAIAGDLVSPKLLGPPARSGRLFLPGAIAAFNLPQSGQTQANAPAQSRKLSKTGKTLVIAGAGVIAIGAFMMTRSNTTISSSVSGNIQRDVQINWKATGGGVAGGGAAMLIIGLTRRE